MSVDLPTNPWKARTNAQRRAWRVNDRFKPGRAGDAELSVYTADRLTALRATIKGESIREGDKVIQLRVGGKLWMSDSEDEYSDHWQAIYHASGRVLIHGLGLGCYLSAILTKPEVTQVDVVEKSADVIALVGPYFQADSRVRLINGDAFTQEWPKGTRWDCVWHDIWADKCADDLAEHSKLMRKFGRRTDWQGCWAHEELLRQR